MPVAFRRDASLTQEAILARRRAGLAGYKQPKGLHFIGIEAFPRSASGKLQRHELKKLLSG